MYSYGCDAHDTYCTVEQYTHFITFFSIKTSDDIRQYYSRILLIIPTYYIKKMLSNILLS